MAAARFWRMVLFDTGGLDLALSSIELWSGNVRVDGEAQFRSSTPPIAPGRWTFGDIQTPRFALEWEFAVEQEVTAFRASASLSGSDFYTALWQYSTDGTVYVETRTQYWWDAEGQHAFDIQFPILRPSISQERGTTVLLYADAGITVDATATNQYKRATNLAGDFTPAYGRALSAQKGPEVTTVQSVIGAQAFDMTWADQYRSLMIMWNHLEFHHLDLELPEFTIEGWFYPLQTDTRQGLFGARSANAGGELLAVMLLEGGMPVVVEGSDIKLYASLFVEPHRWTHFAVTRDSLGVVRLFIDGAQAGGEYVSTTNTYATHLTFGSGYSTANSQYLKGYMDGMRVVKGWCSYTGDFTPSRTRVSTAAPPKRTISASTTVTPPAVGIWNIPAVGVTCPIGGATIYPYDGLATLHGTVHLYGKPVNTPLRRRVRLHDKRDMRLIRETWSDAETGAFRFDNIDPTVPFIAITYDHTGRYCALGDDSIRLEG